MDWTGGYASYVEYTAGFYQEQSPVYLNYVCAMAGVEAVPLDRPFTYFELGFGRGLTANILAASNANGQFYATDFNPAHVSGAQALADSAKLTNLTLLEHSFADLAQGKANLPQFDFITLHGIYTWVNAENRKHIVDFIARYLKPGGIVYLSYNAMPGWEGAQPLQRLMVEMADAVPAHGDTLGSALSMLGKLDKAKAMYFEQNPTARMRLESIGKATKSYLTHEYMHKHWQPLYHADVARDMAEAKLNYAGSAELAFFFPGLYLDKERLELLETLPDPIMRETLKDYLMNTGFRKDVFVRGARKMGTAKQIEQLGQFGLAALVSRREFTVKMKVSFGHLTGNEELYGAVFDALAERPHTLNELLARPQLSQQNIGMVAQIAALLVSSGQASLFQQIGRNTDVVPAMRLNQQLAFHIRYGDEYHALASPLSGNGVPVDLIARLVYLLLMQDKPPEKLATLQQQAWGLFSALGRKVVKDGVAATSDADNRTQLDEKVAEILRDRVPVWRQLKMM